MGISKRNKNDKNRRERVLKCASCGESGRVVFKILPPGRDPVPPTVIEGGFASSIERGTGMSILTCTRCGYRNRLL